MSKCPGCGSRNTTHYLEDPISRQFIEKCKKCGFYRTILMPFSKERSKPKKAVNLDNLSYFFGLIEIRVEEVIQFFIQLIKSFLLFLFPPPTQAPTQAPTQKTPKREDNTYTAPPLQELRPKQCTWTVIYLITLDGYGKFGLTKLGSRNNSPLKAIARRYNMTPNYRVIWSAVVSTREEAYAYERWCKTKVRIIKGREWFSISELNYLHYCITQRYVSR